MWLACAARRNFRVLETDRRRFEAVTDQWRFATGADRQSAAIAAVIDQAAVRCRHRSVAVRSRHRHASVCSCHQFVAVGRKSVVYDAKLWHRAVHVSMFCPDGELRLFCFDEKSSLNIYSLATTTWRSFCSLFSCLSMVACCKLLQKKKCIFDEFALPDSLRKHLKAEWLCMDASDHRHVCGIH